MAMWVSHPPLMKLCRSWAIQKCQWRSYIKQGIVDGSASKPALVQDTNYMVEKTDHIAPDLGAFGAYLMPQWPINGSKGVSMYKNDLKL